MITISELRIHPIKSTKHINVDECEILSHGIRHDRMWALFDTQGQVITARTQPKLLDIQCNVNDHAVSFSYQDHDVRLDKNELGTYNALHIFSYNAHGYTVSSQIDEWFSEYLDIPCRLMQVDLDHKRPVMPKHGGQEGNIVGFGDQAPILILSDASLDDLNSRLEDSISMDHFRPNLIVSGTDPYAEDLWDIIQIGDVKLRVIQQCERCVLTTIDHLSKQKHPKAEPLRTLNKYRKGPRGGVVFGVHAVPITIGSIDLNNTIQVLSTIDRPVTSLLSANH